MRDGMISSLQVRPKLTQSAYKIHFMSSIINKPVRPSRPTRAPPTLSVKLGSWLEVAATGWGILAVPVILGFLLAFAVS